ncbi:hypothetical protein [Mangrovihabitans endophyticus]|uniref:Uncharacterized protein n=1 Tax=Mangrovihabitans endophyticus TaxID=1751298 RepID=A0A8J3C096_9ACTN|nr:hypothetical protein [Mangrovihabitans endophyticus]GGK89489.1 hypothetical protein GCM10012284_24300 [Mangrovihabitans endophyticus]
MTTIPPPPDTGGYVPAAAELRRIADVVEQLPDRAPECVSVEIQPSVRGGDRSALITAVDRVAVAVLGVPGITSMVAGSTFHGVTTPRSGVLVCVRRRLPDWRDEDLDRLHAEVRRLRAENVRLRADAAGSPPAVRQRQAGDPR